MEYILIKINKVHKWTCNVYITFYKTKHKNKLKFIFIMDQNVYIRDINRSKIMIYKNEKWIIDNWDNIFPDLLDKVIQFGYDKEQFLADCDYRLDGMF